MRRLIECVPNFSEGRDPACIDAIVTEMAKVPGIGILSCQSDPDHNRSVITMAGEAEAVREAALRGVGEAAKRIDLRRHSGAHPRIGATDVLPFIPLGETSLEECVTLARKVGEEIWKRYRIPVYLYEAAAQRPERVHLENIRRGQFEGLREAVQRDPERAPDIGDTSLHPSAGAVAVGARKILIAFNINLSTPDVSVASEIARAIRFSSGGLPYVKAIGVELKAQELAQVSINLTDFEQTPLHRVFEMVRLEAERHGCTIVGSEVVGLVPRKALEMAAAYFLRLDGFLGSQILEEQVEPLSFEARGGRSSRKLHPRRPAEHL